MCRHAHTVMALLFDSKRQQPFEFILRERSA